MRILTHHLYTVHARRCEASMQENIVHPNANVVRAAHLNGALFAILLAALGATRKGHSILYMV